MTRPLIISAPGSLMLLGEHAVLHGFPCLVAAVQQRVRISLLPRNDGSVTITSGIGEYEGERNDLPDHPSFRYVVGVLRHLPDSLPGGLDAVITADMPPTIGFGTSAAVTVAMTGALHMAERGELSPVHILADSRHVIQQVQGRGSGADAAASTFGGVVYYRMQDRQPEVISREAHPIAALYCGYKTPTPQVIEHVMHRWRDHAAEERRIYTAMGDCVEAGRAALRDDNHPAFGRVLKTGQRLMHELGVSTRELDEIVQLLQALPTIAGSKISGSGLGDCVIGWGDGLPNTTYTSYATTIAEEGIRIE